MMAQRKRKRCKKCRAFCDGKRTLCDLFAQGAIPAASQTAGSGWPIHTDALGVHPDQVPEAMALAKQRGVPTSFDSMGRPIMTSRRHFKDYAKAHGYHHKGEV